MTEKSGLSYPLDRVDWIEGINLEALRKGRLERAKEALYEPPLIWRGGDYGCGDVGRPLGRCPEQGRS